MLLTDGTITLASTTSLPTIGIIKINSEQIRYETVDTDTNVLGSLTRAFNGTTVAAHTSGATATYVGTVVIDNEIITYTGVSTNDLTSAVRGQIGTSPETHDSGATVTESNNFDGWGSAVSGVSAGETTTTVRIWKQDNFGS